MTIKMAAVAAETCWWQCDTC